MQQSLDAATELDERAELAHRCDAPGHHRALDDRLTDVGGRRPLLFLEQRPARDDEIPALLVLDDPELVDAPFVQRRIGVRDDVDLGEGAEGALAGDTHLVSALHRALDLAFDGKTSAKRLFELPRGGGSEREPA